MKILKTIFAVFVMSFVFLGFSSSAQAATCELVDPIQGTIVFTCKKAHINLSENGSRYLPHPNDVALKTRLTADWVIPFSGNTQLISWDSDQQKTHFWTKSKKKWVTVPENAVMQETGSNPHAVIEVRKMPNGERGWAVLEMHDLMIWNGGN